MTEDVNTMLADTNQAIEPVVGDEYGTVSAALIRILRNFDTAEAVAMASSPAEQGLQTMDRAEVAEPLMEYRWYHSARADLLRRSGPFEEARTAYQRALELTTNATDTRFLEGRLAKVS